MRKLLPIIIIVTLITTAFLIICRLFDSNFANSTIDWFSFLVGIFLITEAIYKTRKHPTAFFPVQFLRTIRMLIGGCIFTVHLIQFIWGIDCKTLEGAFTQSFIDWTAFIAGIFLMVEGLFRIFSKQNI
ncbi:MAG: hypothetical protein KJ983_03140, partial [Candidatus Omnitrophica bacterium]|nr:hypothetical protein [Candidatus Omnitrophota bacterium]